MSKRLEVIRCYLPDGRGWPRNRKDRKQSRLMNADRRALASIDRAILMRGQVARLGHLLNGKYKPKRFWCPRNYWCVRTVKRRELDGFIAQIWHGRRACGCGNLRCDLFQPTYAPFPSYRADERQRFLERYLA